VITISAAHHHVSTVIYVPLPQLWARSLISSNHEVIFGEACNGAWVNFSAVKQNESTVHLTIQ
jgi:hypothetical protein